MRFWPKSHKTRRFRKKRLNSLRLATERPKKAGARRCSEVARRLLGGARRLLGGCSEVLGGCSEVARRLLGGAWRCSQVVARFDQNLTKTTKIMKFNEFCWIWSNCLRLVLFNTIFPFWIDLQRQLHRNIRMMQIWSNCHQNDRKLQNWAIWAKYGWIWLKSLRLQAKWRFGDQFWRFAVFRTEIDAKTTESIKNEVFFVFCSDCLRLDSFLEFRKQFAARIPQKNTKACLILAVRANYRCFWRRLKSTGRKVCQNILNCEGMVRRIGFPGHFRPRYALHFFGKFWQMCKLCGHLFFFVFGHFGALSARWAPFAPWAGRQGRRKTQQPHPRPNSQ